MNCSECNNSGHVEVFTCCKGFDNLLNKECCGMPYFAEEFCKCGIIKLYQVTYIHNNDEKESEIYINAKSEKEAKKIYYSKVENDELPEDSSFSSISEI